jgi:hypothetical protein
VEVTTAPFSLSTHNGIITMKSLKTGEHRTFEIKTQKPDAKFMPGVRLLSILQGPDNTSDYRSIGFVNTVGQVILWRKHREELFYLWIAAALEVPERYLDKVEFSFEGRCRRCNRLLTTPESVASGIGPVCEGIE